MSDFPVVHSCALPPRLAAWRSLVARSIAAWAEVFNPGGQPRANTLAQSTLESYANLDEFLDEHFVMFWFFQRRAVFLSETKFQKWSRDRLDDYILMPALHGFVMRHDCFFVSHFWHSKDDPDPDGQFLRLYQAELAPQEWKWIWVDWSCAPQSPRLPREDRYFGHCLRTMSGIIRNCGFVYFYPPFEARLWILYEIVEYQLTCDGGIQPTPDIEPYFQHIDEMIENGVQVTLKKYDYQLLFRTLNFDVGFVRRIMDHITWFQVFGTQYYEPGIELNKYAGTLSVNGKLYTFTQFPQWDDGKHSIGALLKPDDRKAYEATKASVDAHQRHT